MATKKSAPAATKAAAPKKGPSAALAAFILEADGAIKALGLAKALTKKLDSAKLNPVDRKKAGAERKASLKVARVAVQNLLKKASGSLDPII